jgi:hypothetical protein
MSKHRKQVLHAAHPQCAASEAARRATSAYAPSVRPPHWQPKQEALPVAQHCRRGRATIQYYTGSVGQGHNECTELALLDITSSFQPGGRVAVHIDSGAPTCGRGRLKGISCVLEDLRNSFHEHNAQTGAAASSPRLLPRLHCHRPACTTPLARTSARHQYWLVTWSSLNAAPFPS